MMESSALSPEDVADQLANIELRSFAARLGLVRATPIDVGEELLRRAVACLDDLSWREDATSSRVAILIMSMLWEHSNDGIRAALRERFVIALSRLGLSPTTAMIDNGFGSTGYEAFESFRAELATLAMQLQYSEVIGDREYFLTRFQKSVVRAVRENRLVGISAPTSAGKSFAIYLSIVEGFLGRGISSVVYIVPTVSLINQVTADLRLQLKQCGLGNVSVTGNCDATPEAKRIYVLTQERALWGLQERAFGDSVDILVVDEVQNLERVGHDNELRSKILFDALTDFAQTVKLGHAVLSGPRLEKIGELGSRLFGAKAIELSALESPVASLTYSISRTGTRGVLTQHREFLPVATSRLEIENPETIKGIGQSTYSDEFLGFLGGMITSLGSGSQNIVFSPTSDQSVKTAISLGAHIGLPPLELERDSLSKYLSDSVHPNYSLTKLVATGVAYHHGKVPPHARFAVEESFRDGTLRNLVCTTTLMQGVNLPANVVFIRNPKLYVRASSARDNSELSAYEFANLRGRAGRLMKDLVGRAVVLDEASFAGHRDSQSDLFEDTMKVISPGYGRLFDDNRAEVLSELKRPGAFSFGPAKFVATQVRQAAIRLGEAGRDHLGNLGVALTSEQYSNVLDSVRAIDLDPSFCLRNRYWDPFDLRLLRDSFEASGIRDLPNSVWQPGFANTLKEWLQFHAAAVPYYFDRYFGTAGSERFFIAVAKSSETWSRESPLKKIVDDRHFYANDSSLIDSQIGLIYKHVIFGVPSLLKPLAEMRGHGGPSLAAIESGTYHPISRFLVSRGMFRETAVEIRRHIFYDMGQFEVKADAEILSQLSSASESDTLGPWVRRQISTFIN